MPSQEDYLDELLKGLADSEPEAADLSDVPEETDMPEINEIPEITDMPEITDIQEISDMPETQDVPENADISEMTDMPEISDMPEVSETVQTESSETFEMSDDESFGMSDDESLGMSEEEIDRLLNANQQENSEEEQVTADAGEEDLMSLLENADDSDLLDIHDMLQKSDNNEAVDEDLIALLQEIPDVVNGSSAMEGLEQAEGVPEMEELSEMSEREKRAQEKKRLKEEKAAAKKAAKEAKKAQKEAKKAAKKQGDKSEELIDLDNSNELEKFMEDGNSEEQAIDEFLGSLDEFSAENSEEENKTTDNTEDIPGTGLEMGNSPDDSMAIEMDDIDALLGIADSLGKNADSAEEVPEGLEDIPEKAPKEKKGFFAKILDFLTEEDEEDEESERGTEDIPLSDENRNILEELDQEEAGKKGKKGKKPKKAKKDKKEKKAKDAKASEEDSEDGEEGDSKKGKKAAKPKKEKKPKESELAAPGSKLSLKKIMPVALVCLSVMLVILLLVNLGGDFTVKQEAKKAFYQEDYETCYQNLYGRSLNETEQVMLGKSESVLRIRLWMREYELFVEEGSETEALDVLIQAVNDYAALYEYASQWKAESLISETYEQMLEILSSKYGLSESQALEIAAEPDDVEYTKKVYAVAEGGGYASLEPENDSITEQLPDMLPEEQQFPENNGGGQDVGNN